MYKSGQNRILIAMVVWLYQIFDAEPLMGVDNRSSLVSDEDFGQVDQDDSSKDVCFHNFICHLLRLAVVSTSSNFQPICYIFIAVSFDDYINKPHKQTKQLTSRHLHQTLDDS